MRSFFSSCPLRCTVHLLRFEFLQCGIVGGECEDTADNLSQLTKSTIYLFFCLILIDIPRTKIWLHEVVASINLMFCTVLCECKIWMYCFSRWVTDNLSGRCCFRPGCFTLFLVFVAGSAAQSLDLVLWRKDRSLFLSLISKKTWTRFISCVTMIHLQIWYRLLQYSQIKKQNKDWIHLNAVSF